MACDRGEVRRRLNLREILAELDLAGESDRPVNGYQIKVGSEREPYWLQPEGETYAVVDSRPLDPPFDTEYEARRAQEWFVAAYPGFAWLLEPVHRPIFAPLAAVAA